MRLVEKIKIHKAEYTAICDGKLDHKQGVARLYRLQDANGQVVWLRKNKTTA
jgi:hypothetical protein